MDTLSAHLQALVLEAIRDAVGPAVEDALARALPEILRRAALPVYLTRAQAKEMTGWSYRKLDYALAQRRIPRIKRGRTVLVKTADLEAFLSEGLIPARGSANQGAA